MKVFPLAAETPARGKLRCTSCLWIGTSYLYFGGRNVLRGSLREAPILIRNLDRISGLHRSKRFEENVASEPYVDDSRVKINSPPGIPPKAVLL